MKTKDFILLLMNMSVVDMSPIDSFNVQEFVLYQAIMQIAGMIIVFYSGRFYRFMA